jgi:hypothetical protein
VIKVLTKNGENIYYTLRGYCINRKRKKFKRNREVKMEKKLKVSGMT